MSNEVAASMSDWSIQMEPRSSPTIYQKLAEVQQKVDILQNDSKGHGYRYTSEEEILPKINDEMAHQGLTLYPRIVPGTTRVEPYSYVRKDETVNEFRVTGDTVYRWVDNDTGEFFDVPWSMVGNQRDSSQAFGSALTYSNRYFLLKFFRCATVDDDPDAIRTKQRAGRDKSELNDTLAAVNDLVQAVVATNPKERQHIKEIVTRYVDRRDGKGNLVPTGDYYLITKKAKAAALLSELKKIYQKMEE